MRDRPLEQRQVARDSDGRFLLSYAQGPTNTRQVCASRYAEIGTVGGEASPCRRRASA